MVMAVDSPLSRQASQPEQTTQPPAASNTRELEVLFELIVINTEFQFLGGCYSAAARALDPQPTTSAQP